MIWEVLDLGCFTTILLNKQSLHCTFKLKYLIPINRYYFLENHILWKSSFIVWAFMKISKKYILPHFNSSFQQLLNYVKVISLHLFLFRITYASTYNSTFLFCRIVYSTHMYTILTLIPNEVEEDLDKFIAMFDGKMLYSYCSPSWNIFQYSAIFL